MSEILRFYEEKCDESARLQEQSGQLEYETTLHYLRRYCREGDAVLDACAGAGVYAFPLAREGCLVTAGDLMEVNVQKIRCRQAENPLLQAVYHGSIFDLSAFADSSFDVVLNLGSYYHLCDEQERLLAIRESLRVLKPGGIYFMAYINRYANYVGHSDEMDGNFTLFEKYMQTGCLGNSKLFYASTLELVEKDMREFSLEKLHHIAVDGPMFAYRESLNGMRKENFGRFLCMHLQLCERASLLDCSEHGLFIGRKSLD